MIPPMLPKWNRILLLLSVTLCLTVLYSPVWAGGAKSDEIVVSLVAGTDIKAFNARYGTSVREQLPGATQYLLKLGKGAKIEEVLLLMAGDPQVVVAGPNNKVHNAEVLQQSQAFIDQQSQAFIDSQLHVNFYGQASVLSVRMKEAHNLTRGNGVIVAVIDTGIDLNHPLFAGRLAYPQYDFVSKDANPQEASGGAGYGHGTFVAGLIALSAPGAKIMPLRAFDSQGVSDSFTIVKAIRYAVDNKADIINMSFGLREKDKFIEEAVKYAYDKAFMVTSAGNDNQKELHYPSIKDKTLVVASTDGSDCKAQFSNYHREVNVSAPGVNLYSAYPGRRYATWSGTSFSTALVSGAAALLLQLDFNLKSREISKFITDSGLDINGKNRDYKDHLGRRLDYLNAVNRFYGVK